MSRYNLYFFHLSSYIGSGPFQSHPYRRPLLIAKYEEDFPLRKTGKSLHKETTCGVSSLIFLFWFDLSLFVYVSLKLKEKILSCTPVLHASNIRYYDFSICKMRPIHYFHVINWANKHKIWFGLWICKWKLAQKYFCVQMLGSIDIVFRVFEFQENEKILNYYFTYYMPAYLCGVFYELK